MYLVRFQWQDKTCYGKVRNDEVTVLEDVYKRQVIGLLVVVIILLLVLLLRRPETKTAELAQRLDKLRQEVIDEARASRREALESNRSSIETLGQLLTESQKNATAMQDTRLAELNQQLQELSLIHILGIEDIERAMEPGFSQSPERMGLGFSFMHSFMDKLSVSSTPGEGTTVTMTKYLNHPGEE